MCLPHVVGTCTNSLPIFVSCVHIFLPNLPIFVSSVHIFLPNLPIFVSSVHIFLPNLPIFVSCVHVFLPNLLSLVCTLCGHFHSHQHHRSPVSCLWSALSVGISTATSTTAPLSPVLPLSVSTCTTTKTPAILLVNLSLHFHFSWTCTFCEAYTRFDTELQAPPLFSQAFSLTTVQYFADGWNRGFHTEY